MVTQLIEFFLSNFLAINLLVTLFSGNPLLLKVGITETRRRRTLGLVVAMGFRSGVREQIEGIGLKPLNKSDLMRIVELWDPLKQRTAIASLVYYARHVEKNMSLSERIDLFLKQAGG